MNYKTRGFTLIEILVVIVIIGILGAIMLPQYQRAVLKSRFSGMMPIAKALAESNEVYYLEHGEYSENPADLLVAGRDKDAGAYPDGTSVLMYSDEADLSFVRTENASIPNARYVVYQKHSTNFPDTTWCEARDEQAEAMCVALGGVLPEGLEGNSGADGNWKAYLLGGQARPGDTFASGGSGDNGGDNNDEPGGNTEQEPQTPTCEGAAPTKQEGCPDGCGSVTVTATCEDGEWVYPTADTSSCPDKPDDQTAPCEDSRLSGTQTRSATCNSTGTAWEFTGSWSTTGCTAANIDETVWCYGGGNCTNSSFSGGSCKVDSSGACENNIYTNGAECTVFVNSSASGCNNGTFMDGTVCNAQSGSSCNGGTFKSGSVCYALKANTCKSTFEAGSCCWETDNWPQGRGSCPKGSQKCIWQNDKAVLDPSGATW